ncbi:hypothetical protein [Faecalibacillus faecis]|uniref:hypothetical protein n=1 Tax=Faecalibacillus faecis TaxID=1982628 RepID=UPI00386FE126
MQDNEYKYNHNNYYDCRINNCDILNILQETNISGCYSFYDSMLLALILKE